MKSKLKRIFTLIMTLLLVSSPLITFASSQTKDSLVNVVVLETDEKTIFAQVPRDQVNKYKANLKDPTFKQNQIDSLNLNNRTLPDGKIMSQKHLYRSSIKAACERVQSGAFERFIATYTLPTAAAKVVSLLGASNFWTATAGIIIWRIDDLRIKPEEWWKQAYIDIMDYKINCVRVTHIQNLKPTYPAAWLIIEKL